MNAISWIFRRLTQNEFKAINDQIQSEGGGSQTYIDLPKGKISDEDLLSFFGGGIQMDRGYKWEVPVHSLSLNMPPQEIVVSQRRDSSNCIREQNKEKRINIWKSEYSDFPNESYNESENPIYIFLLKTEEGNFYAGWFYANEYKDNWFLTINLCKPLLGESCGYARFKTPIEIDFNNFNWPFVSLSSAQSSLPSGYNREPKQVIYFGAPGVGKSHHLKSVYKNDDDTVRITFHPETDYASFVGCYKPQTEGNDIVYKFQGQAFTEAYIEAWKRYVSDSGDSKDYFLVIEEINRGNCAQIFGDIFQLLDRDEQGFSDYTIRSDKDLALYLKDELQEIADQIKEYKSGLETGEILMLPPNLHILATMNTSDQSLFPIDSAFKRRWDWVYMPIETKPIDEETGDIIYRSIETQENSYDWGEFLDNVNKRIFKTTESVDKQLGFWFVKPKSGNSTISVNDFVSKVIFFLWIDIYKDFGDDASSIFNFALDGNPESKEKERHSFKDFTPGFQKVNESLVDAFIKNLDVTAHPKVNPTNPTESTNDTSDENSN